MKADYMRQLDFYNPDKDNNKVLIVDSGHIGSYIAFGLARMGVKSIGICDPDYVQQVNLPNQFFAENLIEKEDSILKVLALKDTIKLIMPDFNLEIFPCPIEEFDEKIMNFKPTIIIVAVDSMEVRKKIFFNIFMRHNMQYMIDTRSGGEYANIFYVPQDIPSSIKDYRNELWSDAEVPNLECTGKTVLDMPFAVTSVVLNTYRKHIKNEQVAFHTIIDYKLGVINIMKYLDKGANNDKI